MKTLVLIFLGLLSTISYADEQFKAGSYVSDITPTKLPALINGGFAPKYFDKVKSPLSARCLVLQKGEVKIALAVLDLCIIDKSLLDPIKERIEKEIGIPKNRIMISTTHTHSAPGAKGRNSTQEYKN